MKSTHIASRLSDPCPLIYVTPTFRSLVALINLTPTHCFSDCLSNDSYFKLGPFSFSISDSEMHLPFLLAETMSVSLRKSLEASPKLDSILLYLISSHNYFSISL